MRLLFADLRLTPPDYAAFDLPAAGVTVFRACAEVLGEALAEQIAADIEDARPDLLIGLSLPDSQPEAGVMGVESPEQTLEDGAVLSIIYADESTPENVLDEAIAWVYQNE